jgi:hypothetical protein
VNNKKNPSRSLPVQLARRTAEVDWSEDRMISPVASSRPCLISWRAEERCVCVDVNPLCEPIEYAIRDSEGGSTKVHSWVVGVQAKTAISFLLNGDERHVSYSRTRRIQHDLFLINF